MRIVVFSDVHAILPAWNAFRQDVIRLTPAPDAFWCLGDLVGYGTQPLRVVQDVRDFMQANGTNNYCLQGNHDRGLLQILDGDETRSRFGHGEAGGASQSNLPFQECALKILRLHARSLADEPDDVAWLRSLAPVQDIPETGFLLAHGFYHSRPDMSLWDYGSRDAGQVRKQMMILDDMGIASTTRGVFLGHYHVPALWRVTSREGLYDVQSVDVWSQTWHEIPLDNPADHTLVINPGSLSLPRQQHEAACATYLVLDITETTLRLQFRRLQYATDHLIGRTGVIQPGYPCYDVLVEQIHAVTNCTRNQESPSRS